MLPPLRAHLPRFLRYLAALAAAGSLGLLAGGGLAAGASPPPAHPVRVRPARVPFDAPAAWARPSPKLARV